MLSDDWRKQVLRSIKMHQGYMATMPDCTTRVRITDNAAFLTVKGRITQVSKLEFEYEVPLTDAEQLLKYFCQNRTLEKTRHLVEFQDNTFEVDEFEGKNKGLIVAEIELNDERQKFEKPDWLGGEVTDDERYRNSYLVQQPYLSWK